MARSGEPPGQADYARLRDENEQLRASLESALEENTYLAEERDRLRERMGELSRELRAQRSARHEPSPAEALVDRQDEAEEKLRVAFEELQVLTEELEVANTDLYLTNQDLDARVDQRTRQLKEIHATLLTTEASLRAVADLVPELLWRADANGQADWFNLRWLAHKGHASQHSLGMGWLDVLHPGDQDTTRESWLASVASGKPFEHEHRIRDAHGGYRWFLVRAEPLQDEKGRILRWFVAATDIDAQRTTMEALQRSELRFRTLIEGMPQLVWRAVGCGRWTWASRQWTEYTGQDEAQACGLGWLDAFHPDDRDAAWEAWKRAQQSGGLEIEGRIFHAGENRHRHFRTRASPARDAAGEVLEWLGTSTDVDDLLQLHEEQGILVGELQHRTRNLMAMVQAVTTRTLRGAVSIEQFEQRIQDRFSALARVQGLLSRRDTSARIAFDLLLREELSAHVDISTPGPDAKVVLDGPEGVSLRSATVQTLALALHELATNAVKYGALSDGGRLHVSWRVQSVPGRGPQLLVDWRETSVTDMPAPDAPARGGGYGRELIERALPYQLGARTSYEFTSDGVHCTIEMELPPEKASLERSGG